LDEIGVLQDHSEISLQNGLDVIVNDDREMLVNTLPIEFDRILPEFYSSFWAHKSTCMRIAQGNTHTSALCMTVLDEFDKSGVISFKALNDITSRYGDQEGDSAFDAPPSATPEAAGGDSTEPVAPVSEISEQTAPETIGQFGTFSGFLIIDVDYGWFDDDGNPEPSAVGEKYEYSVTIPESCGNPAIGDWCSFILIDDEGQYPREFIWSVGDKWVSDESDEVECWERDPDSFLGMDPVTDIETITFIDNNTIKDSFIFDSSKGTCDPGVTKASGTLRR
jgi:hypothetical protein